MSLWAHIKRSRLKLCSQSKKKIKVEIDEHVSELTADRSLFARLLLVSRSQRHVDFAKTLGQYELSVVPRSIFAYDGTMNLCSAKSKLMTILKSVIQAPMEDKPYITSTSEFSVAVVDKMTELEAMGKPPTVRTCEDLGNAFVTKGIQGHRMEYAFGVPPNFHF